MIRLRSFAAITVLDTREYTNIGRTSINAEIQFDGNVYVGGVPEAFKDIFPFNGIVNVEVRSSRCVIASAIFFQ